MEILIISIVLTVIITVLTRKREPEEYQEIRKALDEEGRPK